ncbi:MAG TPA: rhomboid family intramembrane serine protease [Actinomycetota bacterium]|nr:rhomboid family intramembrane serine protease [Actinomycetota bacterium]
MLHLIPISDVNPTRRFAVVTLLLIAINVGVFIQTPGLGAGPRATVYFYQHAPVPCQVDDSCPTGEIGPDLTIPERSLASLLGSIVFSTFLHGGLLHLGGNLLFLWIFGNNVEDRLGRIKYLLFYLAGGILASFAHIFWALLRSPEVCTNANPGACIPAVGASGAVAAVMGAYILLYPRARVNVLVPIIFIWTVIQVSAFTVLALWFVYQFFIGAQELSGATEVAWMAHVGGFVFGLIGMFILGGRPTQPPTVWRPEWGR